LETSGWGEVQGDHREYQEIGCPEASSRPRGSQSCRPGVSQIEKEDTCSRGRRRQRSFGAASAGRRRSASIGKAVPALSSAAVAIAKAAGIGAVSASERPCRRGPQGRPGQLQPGKLQPGKLKQGSSQASHASLGQARSSSSRRKSQRGKLEPATGLQAAVQTQRQSAFAQSVSAPIPSRGQQNGQFIARRINGKTTPAINDGLFTAIGRSNIGRSTSAGCPGNGDQTRTNQSQARPSRPAEPSRPAKAACPSKRRAKPKAHSTSLQEGEQSRSRGRPCIEAPRSKRAPREKAPPKPRARQRQASKGKSADRSADGACQGSDTTPSNCAPRRARRRAIRKTLAKLQSAGKVAVSRQKRSNRRVRELIEARVLFSVAIEKMPNWGSRGAC
jgi:hypothetical protein